MTCSLCPSLPFLAKLKAEQEEKELSMASKTPVFPMPGPQHYSNYGFDPQLDYFQVLEEARRHSNRETRSPMRSTSACRNPSSKSTTPGAAPRTGSAAAGGGAMPSSSSSGSVGMSAATETVRGQLCRQRRVIPLCLTFFSVFGRPDRRGAAILDGERDVDSLPEERRWPVGLQAQLRAAEIFRGGDVEVPYLCLSDAAATASCPAPAVPIYLVT